MQDQITRLCAKLLHAEDTPELQPAAERLQQAIRDRMDEIRENAIEVSILSRIVDASALAALEESEQNRF